MNKNWNDRADKDLFFTILSVKNIGVISGAEWTTIGNYMRGLGYGFTNEGCRQHFQGLRRAQNKNEADGSHSDSARRADPTLNPITRRPGPGRGRPRKSQASEAAQPGANDADGATDTEASPTVVPANVPTIISPTAPTMLPGPMVPGTMVPGTMVPNHSIPGQGPEMAPHAMPIQQNQHPQLQSQHPHQHQFQHQQFQQQLQHQSQIPPQLKEEMLKAEMSEGVNISAQASNHIDSSHLAESEADAEADSATSQDQLQLDPVQSGDEDTDEHPAKRQRLEPHDLTQDSALDDEAVLALAAHNGTDATDPYPTDFGYREA
ncbi:hypothetical protein TGAMA5MH_10232 [Trichoderma gamsii]|uniref:Myb-like domain-containing protein n=1 Tax=Trichoderma gamsii TaxID=398673 RepID=A0A2K0SX93_9HYPO|nr:hypothetical protein TGAMA5MH_10232 [Trichoderma gamsii]